MADKVCKYNQSGYCKYQSRCRFRHVNTICEDEECNNKSCENSHPKLCTYFEKFGRCKFGDFCKFSHLKLAKTHSDDVKTKLIQLEDKVNEQQDEISILKDEIKGLKNLLQTFQKDVDDAKESKNISTFKCDMCEKVFKTKNGLQKHMKVHDKIEQIDGNVSINELAEDLQSPEQEFNKTHEMVPKTDVETSKKSYSHNEFLNDNGNKLCRGIPVSSSSNYTAGIMKETEDKKTGETNSLSRLMDLTRRLDRFV